MRPTCPHRLQSVHLLCTCCMVRRKLVRAMKLLGMNLSCKASDASTEDAEDAGTAGTGGVWVERRVWTAAPGSMSEERMEER